jgi:hypothetical protein
MPDDQDRSEKRIDFQSELGMSRRDLLRRSAIVGGAVLWVAPVMQSITQKAYAQEATVSGGQCASCYCYTFSVVAGASLIHVDDDTGLVDDKTTLTASACATLCEQFENSSYCTGNAVSGCRVTLQEGETFADEAALLTAAIDCP